MYPYYPYQSQGLLKVNGIDGARAYQMQPNSVLALFDANEDLFYVKSSDAGGFATITTYSFQKLEQPVAMPVGEFVTRKEFDELKELITNGKFVVPSKQSARKQSPSDDATV